VAVDLVAAEAAVEVKVDGTVPGGWQSVTEAAASAAAAAVTRFAASSTAFALLVVLLHYLHAYFYW
jgi:hypothetical protein